MSIDDYKRALDAAIREYERVAADRAALDTRIAQLQQTIGTLTKLCGYVPTVQLGLTDACRMVLRSAGKPMTAVDVRERLRGVGFDLDKYANALAAIHTVLKRMTESGDIGPVDDDETSRIAYQFLGSGVVASRADIRSQSKPSRTSKSRGRQGP